MAHYIFACDSRGRDFGSFILNSETFQSDHSVIMKPGGQIHHLQTEIEKYLKPKLQNVVIFFAGICNFTKKIRHAGGIEVIYRERNVPEIIQQLDSLNSFLISKNVLLKIASIPPVSLKAYQIFKQIRTSSFSDAELSQQQLNLFEDVEIVNNYICSLNESNFVNNIHLEKDLKKISTKHRGKSGKNTKKIVKYVFNNLYDGVHPNAFLKEKWFNVLLYSTSEFVCSMSVDIESDTDTDITDTWDFKRVASL